MQTESYLKGPCENCGAHIEFPASGLGQSISCPHCGWKTDLKSDAAPIETSVVSHPKKPQLVLLISVVGLGLLAAMAFGFLAAHKNAPSAISEKVVAETKAKNSKAEDDTPTITSPKKHAARRAKKSVATNPDFEFKGLQAFHVAVEKTKSSRLVYATGTIRNQSERQRFGVKVELDLFDEQGVKLGKATDYTQLIEPHKDWNFRAMITEPKVASVKVTAITEE